MKQLFRNFLSLGLLLVFSLSSNVFIQNFVANSDLDVEHCKVDAIKYSKAPNTFVSYLHSYNDFLDEVTSNFSFNSEKVDSKISFTDFRQKEFYTLNKENQYLNTSKHIQPGLNIKTLLYPFHTFS